MTSVFRVEMSLKMSLNKIDVCFTEKALNKFGLSVFMFTALKYKVERLERQSCNIVFFNCYFL